MFAFAPVSVKTPEGAVGVQVTGSFAIQGGPPGDRLVFVTSRRLSYSFDDRPAARSRTRRRRDVGRIDAADAWAG